MLPRLLRIDPAWPVAAVLAALTPSCAYDFDHFAGGGPAADAASLLEAAIGDEESPAIDAASPKDAGSDGSATLDAPVESSSLDASADLQASDTAATEVDAPEEAPVEIVDAAEAGLPPAEAGPSGCDGASADLAPQGLTPSASAVPFDSACLADEVVTGIDVRSGVWTDAVAAICTTFSAGVLGASRTLALNGGTGGSEATHLCPANAVAIGIVGSYGHSTQYAVDGMTNIGLVCADIGSPSSLQIVSVEQPALDTPTPFEEHCPSSSYLMNVTGTVDTNAFGDSVIQFGGRCNCRE